MSLLTTSDKIFWHNYINFYEAFFTGRSFKRIAEIGLLKGNSIRWLLERFPGALVYGADILPFQPEWPVDDRFKFSQFDQGNAEDLRKFLLQDDFDLIIEDGSHFPEHQVLCLVEGIKALKSGGMYVLEDIHTSHPNFEKNNPEFAFKGNALTVLLAIDHYKRIGKGIDDEKANSISRNSIVSPSDVQMLSDNISSIALYKRTNLPDYCYNCGSADFDFSQLKCLCGVDVFSDADSMTFVIQKK